MMLTATELKAAMDAASAQVTVLGRQLEEAAEARTETCHELTIFMT